MHDLPCCRVEWDESAEAYTRDRVNCWLSLALGQDGIEKSSELDRPMAPMKLTDHVADVECGGQSRRAVTLVVMRPALDLVGLRRQERLASVQRLNLRLLIDAKEHGAVGRMELQPQDVADFLDHQRVIRVLKGFTENRLQSKRSPDLLDRRAAQPSRLGHAVATPVGRASRRLFQDPHDHLHDLIIANPARRSWTRLVRTTPSHVDALVRKMVWTSRRCWACMATTSCRRVRKRH